MGAPPTWSARWWRWITAGAALVFLAGMVIFLAVLGDSVRGSYCGFIAAILAILWCFNKASVTVAKVLIPDVAGAGSSLEDDSLPDRVNTLMTNIGLVNTLVFTIITQILTERPNPGATDEAELVANRLYALVAWTTTLLVVNNTMLSVIYVTVGAFVDAKERAAFTRITAFHIGNPLVSSAFALGGTLACYAMLQPERFDWGVGAAGTAAGVVLPWYWGWDLMRAARGVGGYTAKLAALKAGAAEKGGVGQAGRAAQVAPHPEQAVPKVVGEGQ